MAEAFLQIVLENLSSLVKEEVGLLMGVDKEMMKLSSNLTAIQAVLEDAEEKQLQSKPIRDWLRKLNDLAYEIDDVLDECAIHVAKMKHTNNKLSRFGLKNILFRHNIGRRIQQVTEKLDGIAAERAQFHLREIEAPRDVTAARETGSVLNEPHHVYGREDDTEEIVGILMNRVQKMSVLPIIGVGGLGKTTLAQLVFNDQRVVDHFEIKLWVCVSDDFDVKLSIKAMIESATGSGSASDLQHLDALQRRLRELLNQKRYLLVLDDVWNEHQHKWFELRNILACGSAGASVIVTTRLKMVAEIMGTLPTHHLTGLSEEHCWMLLKQRAFGEEAEVSPDLEAIGKQIVKKCAGVPLAAKALGGVLRFKRREDEWIYVEESEIWNLSPEEELILPALRLSYHHLPLQLRQCFAYCAVFGKDFRIPKEELIFYWMAHGYISSKDMLEVEDVGNEICNELVLRSLLQVNEDGHMYMHDLVHDLAESIMESKIPGKQVEENVASSSYVKIREVILKTKFVAFPKSIQLDVDMPCILRKFTRLRVLNASFTSIKELSSDVSNLKHLRWLTLSGTKIHTLPKSLCSLWKLQILNLNGCSDLVALPKNTRYLKNLRQLLLNGCKSLSEMPPKIGEIRCLKTLSLFIVGVSRGNKLEELQFLNLGGELKIKHLERVENHIDAEKANLGQKKNLRSLKLGWERNSNASKLRKKVDEEVLEALEPHPGLETLKIKGFSGRRFPVWMTISTLQKIEIVVCPNCRRLPKLGELPYLKFLRLQHVGVEYIMDDEVEVEVKTQFPSLEWLALGDLFNLKGLFKAQVIRDSFPKLERLDVRWCCSSLILPSFSSSLKHLWAENCSVMTLASFSNMDSLTILYLRIDGEHMIYFLVEVLEKLTSLETLHISSAQELPVLEHGLLGLKSLTSLKIHVSEKPTHIPEGWFRHLTALKTLIIRDCQEFVELSEEMRYLHNLQQVELNGLPKMVSLPKALHHLSSLRDLCLLNLPRLDSLPDWLHHLSSLETLYICNCPKLVRLPTCLQGMTNLQSLYVEECSELERRCERGKGKDWHMILHIPRLLIGDVLYSGVR